MILTCSITTDIKTCQAKGKKIILALGGAAGSYGFTSDSQASGFADTLWNTFGAGNSSTRPFGDAVIDGFDLDIEGGSATGYAAMINQLRTHYGKMFSKTRSNQSLIPNHSHSHLFSFGHVQELLYHWCTSVPIP